MLKFLEVDRLSKKIGEDLVVDISPGSDEENIVNLVELFNENPNDIVTVVGTADSEGIPNTAPVSLMLAKDEDTLLTAIKRGQTTSENLRENESVIVEVVADDDVVVGIKGEAEILREPMENNEAMGLWRIDVEEVKLDTSPAVVVTSGATTEPRSERGAEFESQIISEIREFM